MIKFLKDLFSTSEFFICKSCNEVVQRSKADIHYRDKHHFGART